MALEKKSSKNRGSGKKLVSSLLALVVLAGVGFLGYSFVDNRQEISDLRTKLEAAEAQVEAYRANPQEAANAEVQKYVDEVGKLYTLPENEQPAVATVSDKDKLKDQPFFQNADNGDVTLIYSEAKLAILYRPSTNKIINVSTVTIEQTED